MNGIANVAIDAFVLYADMQTTLVTLKQLKDEPIIGNIYVMMQGTDSCPYEDCEVIQVDDYRSSSTVKKIAEKLKAPYAHRPPSPLAIRPSPVCALWRTVWIRRWCMLTAMW